MTDQKTISAKEFFEGEWYKDGLKQLCADGWPTFVVPVNIKIRELIEENAKLREERDAYAESMRVALRNGVYASKESVRKEIARILGPFLRGADEKD